MQLLVGDANYVKRLASELDWMRLSSLGAASESIRCASGGYRPTAHRKREPSSCLYP